MRSIPLDGTDLGKSESFMPIRQTVLKGIVRIGSMEQKLMPPDIKLLRCMVALKRSSRCSMTVTASTVMSPLSFCFFRCMSSLRMAEA